MLLIFGFIHSSSGQTTQIVRKVVQVMPEQTFYLNGGMRAAFGGKSRTYYKVDLPKNTVEWYYTFSTLESQNSGVHSLKLASQLTRLVDPTGMTAIAVSAIMSPTGSSSCDIYLMDRQNADAFVNKVDNNGGTYTYTISGSRQNYRNGVVQVKDATFGTYYLGFKNPSSSTGIDISFEVAAIVEEIEADNNVWAKESREKLFNLFYQQLKTKNFDDAVSKDVAGCMISNIVAQKTPAGYDNLSQNEKEVLLESQYAKCMGKYKEVKSPEQEKGEHYGSMGWTAFENGDVDKCIEYSKKALSFYNPLGWVKANLGLCYLIKKDEGTATDYYIDALGDIKKSKISSQVKHYLQETINDINNALKKFPSMKSGNEIKSLFQGELSRYN